MEADATELQTQVEELAIRTATLLAPGASAHERDGLERLYAAIRELPEVDRSLILLSLDGLSYREAADIHGISETNVGVRLNRIKARLAKSLKEG